MHVDRGIRSGVDNAICLFECVETGCQAGNLFSSCLLCRFTGKRVFIVWTWMASLLCIPLSHIGLELVWRLCDASRLFTFEKKSPSAPTRSVSPRKPEPVRRVPERFNASLHLKEHRFHCKQLPSKNENYLWCDLDKYLSLSMFFFFFTHLNFQYFYFLCNFCRFECSVWSPDLVWLPWQQAHLLEMCTDQIFVANFQRPIFVKSWPFGKTFEAEDVFLVFYHL